MNHNGRYILKGTTPVPVTDLLAWGQWMETNDRIIVHSGFYGGILVSTVFLGLDHDLRNYVADQEDYRPLIFETMVFNGEFDQYQDRYRTYEDAVAGHHKVLDMITKKLHDKI